MQKIHTNNSKQPVTGTYETELKTSVITSGVLLKQLNPGITHINIH